MQENNFEDLEKQFKEDLLENIRKNNNANAQMEIDLQNKEKVLCIKSTRPNIAITLNNKIVQISKAFIDANISMYIAYNKTLNRTESSFVGEAIVVDLMRYNTKALEVLKQYSSIIDSLIQTDIIKVEKLNRSNKLQIFLSEKFSKNPITDFSIPKKQRNQMQELLEEYKNLDQEIWNYSLKENIVTSLVNYIREIKCEARIVPALLNDRVNPTLIQLGLEDSIQHLQQELIQAYKMDTPPKAGEEEKSRYVPDFQRYERNQIRSRQLSLLIVKLNEQAQILNGARNGDVKKEDKEKGVDK